MWTRTWPPSRPRSPSCRVSTEYLSLGVVWPFSEWCQGQDIQEAGSLSCMGGMEHYILSLVLQRLSSMAEVCILTLMPVDMLTNNGERVQAALAHISFLRHCARASAHLPTNSKHTMDKYILSLMRRKKTGWI